MSNLRIGKKIEMIVYTDKEGNMRPIKFRIENNQGERIVVQVKHAIIKNIKTFGQNKIIEYICQSIVNDKLINYKLTYETNTMQWLLYINPNQL